MNDEIKSSLHKQFGNKCEVCSYDYVSVFGDDAKREKMVMPLEYIVAPNLKRLIYVVCSNCRQASDEVLAKKLNGK
jgi:predicted HNH restriction endonuclease